MNPFHTHPSDFLDNLYLMSCKLCLPFRFSGKVFVSISHLSHSCFVFHRYHPPYSLLHVRVCKVTISLISKVANYGPEGRNSIPVMKEVVSCSMTGRSPRPPKNLKDKKRKLFRKLTQRLMSFLRSYSKPHNKRISNTQITIYRHNISAQVKEDEMGRACSTNGG
jgi:hypothetical protein